MSGVEVRPAAERRGERRFEGELPAALAIGPAGEVRGMACRITSLSASGLLLEAPLEAEIGADLWVKIPGFEIVKCSIRERRGSGYVCAITIDSDARKRLAVWVAWLDRHGQPLSTQREAEA